MCIKINMDCLTCKPFSKSCKTAPQTEKRLSVRAKKRMNMKSENMISRQINHFQLYNIKQIQSLKRQNQKHVSPKTVVFIDKSKLLDLQNLNSVTHNPS